MWGKIITVLFACMLFTACGTPTKEQAPNQPAEENPADEQNIAPEIDDMEAEFYDERDDMGDDIEDNNMEEDRRNEAPGENDDNDVDRNEGDEERNKNEE